jgi:hypothetical protein
MAGLRVITDYREVAELGAETRSECDFSQVDDGAMTGGCTRKTTDIG